MTQPTAPTKGRWTRPAPSGGERHACEIDKISPLGVIVASGRSFALGDRVYIELATGQRAAGKVAWCDRRELGVRFDDSIDVIALLNCKLVSQTPGSRSVPRLEVRCLAHFKCGEHLYPVMLRTISSGGLQGEAPDTPAVEAYVTVFVEGLAIAACEVIWSRGQLIGIQLLAELGWTSIIPWVRYMVRKRIALSFSRH